VPNYARSPDVIAGHRWFYVAWMAPALIGIYLVRHAKRRGMDPLVAGGLWFIVALFPVLGFSTFAYQRFSTAADRYLYLPMFGIAIVIAWALNRATKHRALIGSVTIAILVALGVRSVCQMRYWRDTPALFNHCIEVSGKEPGEREN
jgi:hypothetical protein